MLDKVFISGHPISPSIHVKSHRNEKHTEHHRHPHVARQQKEGEMIVKKTTHSSSLEQFKKIKMSTIIHSSIWASDFQFFDGKTNVTTQKWLSSGDVLFWLIFRMTIAVEKMASAWNVGREIFRQTIARSRFRFKDWRRFDQPIEQTNVVSRRARRNKMAPRFKKKKKTERKKEKNWWEIDLTLTMTVDIEIFRWILVWIKVTSSNLWNKSKLLAGIKHQTLDDDMGFLLIRIVTYNILLSSISSIHFKQLTRQQVLTSAPPLIQRTPGNSLITISTLYTEIS